MDDNYEYYTVVLKIDPWPDIYHGQIVYAFPTEKAAMAFAKGNLSSVIPAARVYAPNNQMLALVGNPFA